MGVIEPVLIGISIGICSGLVGMGGGALLVPMLIFSTAWINTRLRGPRWPCCWLRAAS